ncbi:hypothetical protein BJY24_002045 [Nocardia transvalensis]|uniref:Uncharacterized protein n=1 Tax=Nocardia transvalensis TaxID=37333 RepID=A0A7W9PCL0_9NOCA|nr:hypothetical protein [Nocardia transvalensis]MBB5913178.1 hypothetical protein [Nocardia transvalensis]
MTVGHHLETAEQTRHRRIVNAVVAGVLVLIAVIGLLVFEQTKQDSRTEQLAQQLHDRLVAAGLPAPDTDVIGDSLGSDGGLICQDPTSPLIAARYRSSITNGASGPGSRPVIADRDTIAATELAIDTYCPDHLRAYLERMSDLKLGDTTK